MKRLRIVHLYPREMNIYGDLGNIITLVKRLEWRGMAAEIVSLEAGEPFDLTTADIVFGGGGQDSGQLLVGHDLQSRGEDLRQMAQSGVPMLTVCGLYQLFGRGFTTLDGREIPGIDVFAASTAGAEVRMIGNIVIESELGQLVGFENHSGQTSLEPGQRSLGQVRQGYGNNPVSGQEGAWSNAAIGTYLHGPVLPKNPALADYLILAALRRHHHVEALEPLDDALEHLAAQSAARRPQ